MGFTDYRKNLWLGQFDEIWLALHFDNPDIAGAYASEVFGGSYTRVEVAMSDPTAGAVFVVTDAKFPGLANVRITHYGGWDSQINGNLEFSVALPNPIRVVSGSSHTVVAGNIALSFADLNDSGE